MRTGAELGPDRIEGYDFESGRRTVLTEGVSPRVTETGHLVFGTPQGVIMAATLDTETLELGTPVALIHGVQSTPGYLNWSLSSDGTLGYWEAGAGAYEMVWVSRSGVPTPASPGWTFDAGPSNRGWALSPDNSRLAVRLRSPDNGSVWIKDLRTGALRRLTLSDDEDRHPFWISDSVVGFLSAVRVGDGARWQVLSARADGVGEPQLIYENEDSLRIGKALVSPGGEWLVLRTYGPNSLVAGRDIMLVRLGSGEEPRPLIANPTYGEHQPALSSDGRWLAYSSTESGRNEVSVRPFPDVDAGRVAVSIDGGVHPMWSADGTELFYGAPGRMVMAARVEADPDFRVVSREELFEIDETYVVGTAAPFAVVAEDGRFLMMRLAGGRLVLVENWFKELERLVPHHGPSGLR